MLFRGCVHTARTLAYLRINRRVAATTAPLATGPSGSTLAGREFHPLDGSLSFTCSSHAHAPPSQALPGRNSPEVPGIKAPSTFPRARFLIERAKDGLKVAIAGRPDTEEKISAKQLSDSVWRAARDYCTRHFGEWTGGRARGLGLRFQAALAGK